MKILNRVIGGGLFLVDLLLLFKANFTLTMNGRTYESSEPAKALYNSFPWAFWCLLIIGILLLINSKRQNMSFHLASTIICAYTASKAIDVFKSLSGSSSDVTVGCPLWALTIAIIIVIILLELAVLLKTSVLFENTHVLLPEETQPSELKIALPKHQYTSMVLLYDDSTRNNQEENDPSQINNTHSKSQYTTTNQDTYQYTTKEIVAIIDENALSLHSLLQADVKIDARTYKAALKKLDAVLEDGRISQEDYEQLSDKLYEHAV